MEKSVDWQFDSYMQETHFWHSFRVCICHALLLLNVPEWYASFWTGQMRSVMNY